MTANAVAHESASLTFQSGVRFPAYPSRFLQTVLAQWIGCQRVIYNGKVEEDGLFASQRRLVLMDEPGEVAATPLDQAYSQFKNDSLTPWFSEVPSQILRNGSVRWMTAKQRQLKGLAKAPVRRTRHNFNSVLITNELFRFYEWIDHSGKGPGVFHAELELGTYRNPVGVLKFNAHRESTTPKQITIRRTGDRWWISFNYEHAAPEGFIPRNEAELAYELANLDDEALKATTLGLDRNVKHNCVATSDGRFYALSPAQKICLERKAIGAKRVQRKLVRQVKGSKNRAKTRNRLNRKHEYRGNVARDFSHQTSHSIVTESANGTAETPRLIVFENLKIQNMTARPRALQDANGKWLRNGAAQKASLSRSILSSCWGSIAEQAGYKSYRLNTLVLKAPASYSSQECSRCGHTHPDNRFKQRFVCQRCGFTDHADTNAYINMGKRGISMVRDGKVVVKPKKSVAFCKGSGKNASNSSGPERPGVSVEGRVRRAKLQDENSQYPPKQKDWGTRPDAPATTQGV